MDADFKPVDTRIVRKASDRESKRMYENLIAQNDNKNGVSIGSFGKFKDMTLIGEWPKVNQTNMLMAGAKPNFLHQLKGTKITVDFQHIPPTVPQDATKSLNMHKILEKPPHKLTDAEIASYRNPGDAYQKIRSETAKLGNVMVLKTYTDWVKMGKKQLSVTHDLSGKGNDCYMIIFEGPAADFDKNLATIEKSLKTAR